MFVCQEPTQKRTFIFKTASFADEKHDFKGRAKEGEEEKEKNKNVLFTDRKKPLH